MTSPSVENKTPVQFLFPGHGSERIDMTRGLYKQVESFRNDVDGCLKILNSLLEFELKSVLFPENAQRDEAIKQLSQTAAAQPALFTIEYSLAKLLNRLGIAADGMLGHSVSEYVAACLAGVFSLETALEIVAKRGQLVQSQPEGAMLAIALPEAEVIPHLNDRIDLGSTIGESQCVVSGYPDSIQTLKQQLCMAGVECKPVKVTRAFHSMMLDPILETFGEFVAGKKLNPPGKAFISGIDGNWIDSEKVQTADYWVSQLRSPVRFFEGISELAKNTGSLYLEVGKGAMLTSLVRGHPDIDEACNFITTSPASYQTSDDLFFLMQSLDRMESLGWDIDKSCLNYEGSVWKSTYETGPPTFSIESKAAKSSENARIIEKEISKYFCQILGVDNMDRDQNFIAMGGNSLMAMQVISKIRTNLGVVVPIKVFFDKLTIVGVINYITSDQAVTIKAYTEEETESEVDVSENQIPETRTDSATPLRHELNSKANSTIDFSLFFFAGDEGVHPEDRYKLVMDGARFADDNDFDAIWLPERHFNKFGGLYPNPSVLGAALAVTTKQIHIRGGSVVAPLHHPVRIAEEWSVLDNLSNGRIGISFGSGFHPKDFLLAPQAFSNRKEVMFDSINIIQHLWQGGRYKAEAGGGEEQSIELFPTPYSKELPMWLSTTRSPDTFAEAGALGGNVLTALLRLSVEELSERIGVYRKAREDAGHDPGTGIVTVMLHTFVGSDMDYVRSNVEAPMKEYLRSHMEHTQAVSTEKAAGETIELSTEEEEELLDHAFKRYFETSSLMGTEAICLETIEKLKSIGVNEVACLIDFGVEYKALMNSLKHLNNLRRKC